LTGATGGCSRFRFPDSPAANRDRQGAGGLKPTPSLTLGVRQEQPVHARARRPVRSSVHPHPSRGIAVHRVLSWKRLLIVLGVVVVLTAAALGVHHLQYDRQASALYDQARRVEKDDPEKAIELMERYLKYRPKDEDAAIWYLDLVFAQAQADPKKAQRAVDGGEKVLRNFRDHPAHRRKLVEMYVLVGQYRDPTIL